MGCCFNANRLGKSDRLYLGQGLGRKGGGFEGKKIQTNSLNPCSDPPTLPIIPTKNSQGLFIIQKIILNSVLLSLTTCQTFSLTHLR